MKKRKITWLAVPASGGWEGQEQLPCLLGLDTAHVLARHPKTFTSDLFCVSCWNTQTIQCVDCWTPHPPGLQWRFCSDGGSAVLSGSYGCKQLFEFYMAMRWPFDLCHPGSPVAPNSHLLWLCHVTGAQIRTSCICWCPCGTLGSASSLCSSQRSGTRTTCPSCPNWDSMKLSSLYVRPFHFFLTTQPSTDQVMLAVSFACWPARRGSLPPLLIVPCPAWLPNPALLGWTQFVLVFWESPDWIQTH